MSANAATINQSEPVRRPKRKLNLTLWAGSVIIALGLGLLLAGTSVSDVTNLSDALGVPVETSPLPAHG